MNKTINILISIVFIIGFIGANPYKHYSKDESCSAFISKDLEKSCMNMMCCTLFETKTNCPFEHENKCSCDHNSDNFLIVAYVVSEKYLFSKDKKTDYFISPIYIFKNNTFSLNYRYYNLKVSPSKHITTDVQSEFCVLII